MSECVCERERQREIERERKKETGLSVSILLNRSNKRVHEPDKRPHTHTYLVSLVRENVWHRHSRASGNDFEAHEMAVDGVAIGRLPHVPHVRFACFAKQLTLQTTHTHTHTHTYRTHKNTSASLHYS